MSQEEANENASERSFKLPFKIFKPVVFLDIEATGPDAQNDKIIEIHCQKFNPDETQETFYAQVNPCEPIPLESTAIHGFTNKDLTNAPSFKKIAKGLFQFLSNVDIGGYNVMRFDLRILFNEFKRVDLQFDLASIRILDPFQIFVKKQKRDLSTAYEFFCGKKLENAHGAKADNLATIEVLLGQLAMYEDLPKDLDGLSDFCFDSGENSLDPERFLVWRNNKVVVNFGKHKGRLLEDVAREDHSFLYWVSKNNFNPVLIRIVNDALKGKFPKKESV